MQERKKRKGIEKYKEMDKEIRHICKERKEAWWNEKCEEIEEWERKHKTKEMHAKVKEMSTKKHSKSGTNCICDENVKTLFDSNDIDELYMSRNCIERERDKFICNPMGWIQTHTIHTI